MSGVRTIIPSPGHSMSVLPGDSVSTVWEHSFAARCTAVSERGELRRYVLTPVDAEDADEWPNPALIGAPRLLADPGLIEIGQEVTVTVRVSHTDELTSEQREWTPPLQAG